jgi:Protein of unknown function (DUF2752)
MALNHGIGVRIPVSQPILKSNPTRDPPAPLPVRRIAALVLAGCLLLLLGGSRGLDTLRSISARLSGESSVECSFRARYGFDCLGCGGTRAFDRAAHGQLGAAFRFNRLGAMVGVATWLTALGAAVSLLSGRARYLAVAAVAALILLSGAMAVHGVLWWRALPPGFHLD